MYRELKKHTTKNDRVTGNARGRNGWFDPRHYFITPGVFGMVNFGFTSYRAPLDNEPIIVQLPVTEMRQFARDIMRVTRPGFWKRLFGG